MRFVEKQKTFVGKSSKLLIIQHTLPRKVYVLFFTCFLESILLRETFRGPIMAISLAPSARSGRVHAHVKGVVQ